MAQFDKYGRWINPNYQSRPVSSFVSSYRSPRRNGNIWSRVNNFITNIGDWIEDNREAFANNITIGICGLALLGLVVGLIFHWYNSGFWSAILTTIVVAAVIYFAGLYIAVIFGMILHLFFIILRYIFYNIYTLLTFIILLVGVFFYPANISGPNKVAVQETVSLPQPNYYCSVSSVLKVREYPQLSAKEIGQLKSQEEVYVYSIDKNNFAKIHFNGRIAYASADYLKPKDKPVVGINTHGRVQNQDNTSKSATNNLKKDNKVESIKTRTTTTVKQENTSGQYTGNRNSKGQRHGEGTYIWPNGDKYVGNWENDNMSGYGEYTYANGKLKNGIWDSGVYLGTVKEVSSQSQ